MIPKKETMQENTEQETRFYIIFSELAKTESTNISDVSLEEIDDIEQVRRMVLEVTDDRPVFMTST